MEKKVVHGYRTLLEQSEVFWKLSRLLSLDSVDEYNLFASVWRGAYGPEKDLTEYFLKEQHPARFVRLYNEVREDDRPSVKIKKDENEYFKDNEFRKTIAKKVTLVSGWKARYTDKNPRRIRQDMFVTSAPLWKWIQRFMKDWEAVS